MLVYFIFFFFSAAGDGSHFARRLVEQVGQALPDEPDCCPHPAAVPQFQGPRRAKLRRSPLSQPERRSRKDLPAVASTRWLIRACARAHNSHAHNGLPSTKPAFFGRADGNVGYFFGCFCSHTDSNCAARHRHVEFLQRARRLLCGGGTCQYGSAISDAVAIVSSSTSTHFILCVTPLQASQRIAQR